MTDIIRRFEFLEREITREKGEFSFFALFERDELPDRWDLLFAAPWATNEQESGSYMVEKIKTLLGLEDLVSLSRIVVVDSNNLQPGELAESLGITDETTGTVEVGTRTIFGVPVKRAFIIKASLGRAPVT
jgi:hypothetical protein